MAAFRLGTLPARYRRSPEDSVGIIRPEDMSDHDHEREAPDRPEEEPQRDDAEDEDVEAHRLPAGPAESIDSI
jgi:hypothetical protein